MAKEANQIARDLASERFTGLDACAVRREFAVNPSCNAAPEGLKLGKDEVHIWSFCLDVPSTSLSRFKSVLSSDEQERARRFHFEKHRSRYIAGRGGLRTLLSHYLGVPLEELTFRYGNYGKPELLEQAEAPNIHFNLSHSDSMACVAVTRAGPVGLDIEHVKPLHDMGELVNRFFSPRESSLFERLDQHEQPDAFFNLWTRKEAWLKATGEGISQFLKQVEVSFLPGEKPQLLQLPDSFKPACKWSLYAWNVAQGLKGALAIAVDKPRIVHRHWDQFGAATQV